MAAINDDRRRLDGIARERASRLNAYVPAPVGSTSATDAGGGETGSMAQVIPLPVRSPVELGGGARRVCRLWLPTYVSGRQPAIMRTLVLTEAVACRDRANQLWASAEPLPQTQLRPLRSADVHCLRQDRR